MFGKVQDKQFLNLSPIYSQTLLVSALNIQSFSFHKYIVKGQVSTYCCIETHPKSYTGEVHQVRLLFILVLLSSERPTLGKSWKCL